MGQAWDMQDGALKTWAQKIRSAVLRYLRAVIAMTTL